MKFIRTIKNNYLRNYRKLFFLLIGLFSKIIRKIFYFNSNRNHELIAVCGRGYSANKFFEEDFFLHTKVYLANFTREDLPRFDYYLKLRKKEISLVTCIDEWTPNFFYSLFLNIRESIISRPDNLLNLKAFKSDRFMYRMEALGSKVRGITNSKSMYEYPMTLGNTGIIALYEACEYAKKNNIKSIFIYGFDLYSKKANIQTTLKEECESYGYGHETYIHLRSINEKLSKKMDYLISLYPEIIFKNYTLNLYDFKSENIENIYVEDLKV